MLTAIRNLNYIRSKDPRLYEAVSDVIQKAKSASEKVSLGSGMSFNTVQPDIPLAAGDLDAVQVLHVFSLANTPYTIPHNLGRFPTGYIVVTYANSLAATIFNGNSAHWTDKTIELQSTAPTTVRLLIF